MAASDPTPVHHIAFTAALLGYAALVGCGGEFVHSNPFDPEVPITLRIEGPDKTVAQFDTVRFKLTTDPAYEYGSAVWSATGGLEKLDENGTFRAPRIGLYTGPVQVTATLGPRKAQTTIQVTYQPASFRMYSCADSSRTITIAALDTTGSACAIVYDARGGIISSSSSASAPIVPTSLDTSIAKVDPVSSGIRSVKNGTTKVVYRFNGVADTLTVVVRQRVTSLTITPSSCGDRSLVMPVGSTLQLKLGAPAFDATGHPVTDTAEIQDAIATAVWERNVRGYISITAGGLVTAEYAGGWELVGYAWQRNSTYLTFGQTACYITVTP